MTIPRFSFDKQSHQAADASDFLRSHGWVVCKLLNTNLVLEAREFLLQQLRTLTGHLNASLENYHELGFSNERHTELQYKLTTRYRELGFGPEIATQNRLIFNALIGGELNVQAEPYLRITRPGAASDNIGYHRDTFYGGSPLELSMVTPFVPVAEGAALRVLSGSHFESDESFRLRQIDTTESGVAKGDQKHQMGFLYAPKVMLDAIEDKMTAVPLEIGEVLIFSLATVHGTTGNSSPKTRWSSDIRVCAQAANIDLSSRPTYYKPMPPSPSLGSSPSPA
jgi:hypothetical protein